ncbi:MAG: ATP synthase F1 subunit epsilon [Paramuribaculum sp.]|nr:ATP synthase F1 subunit epsilon [Paramuribaculum sp.]
MTLKIISPEDVVFEGEVSSVTLPGQMGEFTVLKNHASLVSVLNPGTITYVEGSDSQSVRIQGGLVDVDNNVISVCLC